MVGAEPATHAQLRDRQAASGTSALFDEDLQPCMGTIAAQYFSYDLYDKNAHKDKGAFGSTFMVAGTAQRYQCTRGRR